MESLYFLVPIALLFLVLAVRFLFWAVNSGQYDDLDTEGHRILFDDETTSAKTNNTAANSVKPIQSDKDAD